VNFLLSHIYKKNGFFLGIVLVKVEKSMKDMKRGSHPHVVNLYHILITSICRDRSPH
jgi:hypothetical protein